MDIKRQIEEEKLKLRNLFYEMLDYKHKKYDKSMDFFDLLELTSIHYNAFSIEFDFTYYEVKYSTLPPSSYDDYGFDYDDDDDNRVSDEKKLEQLKELYDCLTEDGNDYKVHANDYIDINLEEGQTLKDLLREKEEKFGPLFKEMLDFVGVDYSNKKIDFYDLWLLVANNYPWYYDRISNLKFVLYSSLDCNYVQQIDTADRNYKRLLKYKEEYPMYVEKYSDIVKEHEAWLKTRKDSDYNDPYKKIIIGEDPFECLDLEID